MYSVTLKDRIQFEIQEDKKDVQVNYIESLQKRKNYMQEANRKAFCS